MKATARIEYKYYLPAYLECEFVANLLLFSSPDRHSGQGKGYEIASVYYDNFGLQSYHDKMAGASKRTKLRLRFYPPLLSEGTLNVELKHKLFDRIIKEKGGVLLKDLALLFEGSQNGNGLESKDPVLSTLSRMVLIENYYPFIRIDYSRRAFVDRHDSNVRMTVDSNIFCQRFMGDLRGRPDIPVLPTELLIFEIKSPDYMPFWLTVLLQKYGLERKAISKYALAVQNLAVNETAFLR